MGKKWKVVGRRRSADGNVGQLLEAVQPIECYECGKTISPGELFTRRLRKGGGYAQFPLCEDSSPFERIDGNEQVP